MDVAIVFNIKSGKSRVMRAVEFEELIAGNEQLKIAPKFARAVKEDFVAVSPKDGLPLRFARSYYKSGSKEQVVPAHWARPDGFGNHDHVFGEPEKQSLAKALDAGKSVLLSLNLNLTPQPINFENMREKRGQNLNEWIGENKGHYISIPIHSAQEALNVIRQIHAHDPEIKLAKRVFAVCEGAVVPYHNFYLGTRSLYFAGLYAGMQNGLAGIPFGEERMIGFPRLFHFVPTTTTLREHGHHGLKGNHVKLESGKPLFSKLIFAHEDDKLKTDAYKKLEAEITEHGRGGIYLLACPSVTIIDPALKSPRQWAMLRWIINDIQNQTAAADPQALRRLRSRPEYDEFIHS